MNPTAILALIGDLYAQIATLTEDNQQLRQQVSERAATEAPAS